MKKLKYILTSILTVVMCFSVLTITTSASVDYNVKTLSFTHGNVSISSGFGEDVTGTLGNTQAADIYNYLSFTFDKYYSGTVTLKWSYSSSAWRQNITDWNILVIGGKIDSNNNTSGNIVFRVYDKDSFMVIMTYNTGTLLNGTDPTFNFTSATSSLTAVANHNSQYDNIADIETELVSANTQLTGIVSLLGALQNLQNTISTNVADIEDYLTLNSDGITNTDIETKLNLITGYEQLINGYLTNIDTNLSSVINNQTSTNSLLNNIESNTDGIEGLLTAIEGTLIVNGVSSIGQIASTQTAILAALSSQGSETLYDLVTDIVDMFSDPNSGLIAELTALNALVTTTNNKLDEIKTSLTNINTSINNIDSLIDTISWNTVSNFLGVSQTPFTDFVTVAGQVDNTYYYQFDLSNNFGFRNYLYYIQLPINQYNNSNLDDFNIYAVNSSGTISDITKGYYIYYFPSRSLPRIYFYPKNQNAVYGNNAIFIKYKTNTYYYYTNRSYAAFKYLPDTDIEYWQLITYLDQLNTNKQILENLLIDVDSETSLTIYNNDNDILDNINNGFGNEYSVFRPIINQQLAPLNDSTLLNEFSNQRTLFDYLFRNLFNIDPNVEDPSTVTNPVFLILIFGGILLALVG